VAVERTYKTIKVTPVTHGRVAAIRQGLTDSKQREVTFSEMLDILADAYDRCQARRVGDTRDGKQ